MAQTPDKPADTKLPLLKTSITVTETISAETPAPLTILDNIQIEETPGVNMDDRLRTVPGFTLFRRTSSLVANPTTQGVSLRGLGSTGASRTLVLWDSIPANDPFGGWVYWDRFAPQELDRVEINRGASTSIFGDLALGGAVALFSEQPSRLHAQAGYEGGNENSHEAYAGASEQWRYFAASAFVRAFRTDGYFIVPSSLRGSADTPANVEFVAGNTRFDILGAADRMFLRLDILSEHRDNGTALTHNSSGLGTLAANYSHLFSHDQVSAVAYYTTEEYRASFSSVTNRRNTERNTYFQTVPSEAVGGAAFWRHNQSRWNLLAGADVQRTEGFSTDRLVPSGLRVGGGQQRQNGVFSQFEVKAGPVQLFLGAREQLTSRDTNFFSPSAGFATGRRGFRVRGSVYRAFRLPTLNELFRVFSVGNTVTMANAALRPETLFGAEFGFDYSGENRTAGITFYRNQLNDLITNVTLSNKGGQIVRQRQNAAQALARGIEAHVHQRWGNWSGDASYLLADSRYSNGPRLPEVPRNQGTAQVSYNRGNTLVAVAVRAYSAQFDDDINQFLLPGFATAQISAEQKLRAGFSARGELENLLDRQYLVALTPTPNTGSPRLWRLGLRWTSR